MAKLSNTDKHNLETLAAAPSTEFKGAGRAMRKLIDAGFVAQLVVGRSYVYATTEKGKLEIA